MIGNDVVDLSRALVESDWKRKGFLTKVYCQSEQQIIKEASDTNLMVWLLWTMKEAAYKAHQRMFQLPRQLNWKDQQCSILSFNLTQSRGLVRIKGNTYSTITDIYSNYVHTTATYKSDLEVDSFCEFGTGVLMHKMLFSLVSKILNLPVASVHLGKNSHGVPSIFYGENEVFTQFSFSGHGRFYALSLALTEY